MRFRVDTRYSSVSYDEKDEALAWALYEAEGHRIVLCEDLFDEGIVLAGLDAAVVPRAAIN